VVMTDQPTAPLILNTSESWSLLRDEAVGRLAVVVDDQPEIFPVNHPVDHEGTAREVNRLHDVLDALELPLFPWHAAPKPCTVRIEPNSISG